MTGKGDPPAPLLTPKVEGGESSPYHFYASNPSAVAAPASLQGPSRNADVDAKRCGVCIGCFRQHDCQKCASCLQGVQPCDRRRCIQANVMAAVQLPPVQLPAPAAPPAAKAKRGPGRPKTIKDPAPPKEPKKRGRPKKNPDAPVSTPAVKKEKPPKQEKSATKPKAPGRRKTKKDQLNGDLPKVTANINIPREDVARHCFGPHCTRCARRGSKYCSDECGMAMAKNRIEELLPERLKQHYERMPLTEVNSDQRMYELLERRKEVELKLEDVAKYRQNLILYINALEYTEPSANTRGSTHSSDTSSVYCFICGQEERIAGIARHTQRCFERLEKQSTFGTATKVRVNPFDILCETYDKHTKSYCKRLRIVCPEHYKDEIGKKMKTCGYPLKWEKYRMSTADEMFGDADDLTAEGMCMRPRAGCLEHKAWERNAIGVIDNLRMNYFIQIDEFVDAYRRIQMLCDSHSDPMHHLLSYTLVEDLEWSAKSTIPRPEVNVTIEPAVDVKLEPMEVN
ncbi:CXXC-type zinc finger protein 1 [Aphelenchoides fujianensis]|nr:CXXC-type zinc finger protein 1 [Aphelenchoides fujianensis]